MRSEWLKADKNLFEDQVAVTLDMTSTMFGLGRWRVPAAAIVAPSGWDDRVWINALPDHAMPWIRSVGTVLNHDVFGRRAASSRAEERAVTLSAKGAPNRFTAPGPVEFGHVYLPDDLIDEVAGALGHQPVSGRLRDDFVFGTDPELHGWCEAYVRRAEDGAAPPTALEMDLRGTLIVERLLTRHHDLASLPVRGGLPPALLRRVCERLAADLAGEVTLAELAALAGLSPSHLCRAFKTSTGVPPHRWRLRRRLEAACALLAGTDLPVGAIAAEAGFADPSRLSVAFRRQFGVTPTGYRRRRR